MVYTLSNGIWKHHYLLRFYIFTWFLYTYLYSLFQIVNLFPKVPGTLIILFVLFAVFCLCYIEIFNFLISWSLVRNFFSFSCGNLRWSGSRAPPEQSALLFVEIPGVSHLEASISVNFLVWNFLGHSVQGSSLGHPFYGSQFCSFHSEDTQNCPLGSLVQGMNFSLLTFLFTEEAALWGSCLFSRVLFSTLFLMAAQGFTSFVHLGFKIQVCKLPE